jgi:formylglycine-generating enzyme required for sulfatase activity
VLDRYCAACHSGVKGRPDLRAAALVPGYKGIQASVPGWWSKADHERYDANLLRAKQRKPFPIRFTPAYEALHPYARRYGLEGDYELPYPGEYHSSTSELIQMLEKGHHGVRLDAEAWDRLHTWIDLNVPAHGTWGQIYPIPFNGRNRRIELAKLYGGVEEDFEAHPPAPGKVEPVMPKEEPVRQPDVNVPGWPFTLHEARQRQAAAGRPFEREVDLGKGVKLKLVLVPAGEYLMGSAEGAPDERPLHAVTIAKPFWMAATEITNEQYKLFDASHDSRYINVLNMNTEQRGLPVNGPKQPVVRVSFNRATEFCTWLSRTTGLKAGLPTEEQWEWAARAGTGTPFHFGPQRTAFDQFANLADASLRLFYTEAVTRTTGNLRVGQQDWMLRAAGMNDKQTVTAPAGTYYPNAWGLHDMHGNVAEWTRSEYRDYATGKPIGEAVRKVARGGSWNDRPHRATSGFRWAYPAWQPVYNVGIRVIAEAQ